MVDRFDHTILITTDTVGGVWSYTISLVEAMRLYPVNFVIAAIGPLPNEHQVKQIKNLDNAVLETFEGKLEWMENPWQDINDQADWLKTLNSAYQPDIIHFNHYAHVHIEFNAPKLLVMHSCVKSWWKAVKNEDAPDEWSRYGALVQKAILSADEVITPSQAILNDYKKQYRGLKNAKVIYNGIDLKKYNPAEKDLFIFSMGRIWDEAKNIQLLLKAAKDIDFPIYIAGKSENRQDLPSNVKFLGWLSEEEVKVWLSKAAVYALPVKYEPFGLSFLEASASGCVLIGGKISTLREIWSDTAFLCETDDPKELATLINVIIKDENLRKEMSKRSYQRAMAFNLEKTAKSYYNLYESKNSTLSKHEY